MKEQKSNQTVVGIAGLYFAYYTAARSGQIFDVGQLANTHSAFEMFTVADAVHHGKSGEPPSVKMKERLLKELEK